MKSQIKNLSVLFLIALIFCIASIESYAGKRKSKNDEKNKAEVKIQKILCPKDIKYSYSGYDVVYPAPSGNCVGLRVPGDQARNRLDGEVDWIDGSTGVSTEVGPAPYDDTVVATESGVLLVYFGSRDASVQFWDKETKSLKVCNKKEADKISLRHLRQGKLQIIFGEDFVQVKDSSTAKTYYEGCEDSGSQLVFADLSASDRAVLESFGAGGISNNLTDPAVNASLPDILGRDDLVSEIISSLKTDSVRSTLLWGPAGTGKTSIAYRLASMIVKKEGVPRWLEDWSVYMIDLSKLNGEGLAGKAEKKMSDLISAASGKKVILVMDEFHQLLSMGTGGGDSTDLTEPLKPNLANGQLAIIGTLTDQSGEMAALRQKKAIYERFNRIKVMDPSDEVLMKIYRAVANKMFKKFSVTFSDKMLGDIVTLSRRYIPQEHHPRVGVKIIQKVASALNQKREDAWKDRSIIDVTKSDLRYQIGLYGNVSSLIDGEGKSFKERVFEFEDEIRKKYVGHDNAIGSLAETLQMVATGNRPKNRPSGVFLFLGPSGVGKTYLTELYANYFDIPYKTYAMNQFKSDASVNNLLGAWKGYTGYDAGGGSLTKWIQDNQESVVNFDEVEKAHVGVIEVLLRLMDSGQLEDNAGNEADFRNGHIFMTSNFGLPLIDAYDKKVRGIEDPNELEEIDFSGFGNIPKTEEALKRRLMDLMIEREAFGEYTQAFLGRVDHVIIFHHFNEDEQQKVAGFEVKKALKDINADYRDKVVVSKDLMDYILLHGFDFHTGARNARGLARKYIVGPIAKAMMMVDEDAEIERIDIELQGLSRGTPKAVAKVKLK